MKTPEIDIFQGYGRFFSMNLEISKNEEKEAEEKVFNMVRGYIALRERIDQEIPLQPVLEKDIIEHARRSSYPANMSEIQRKEIIGVLEHKRWNDAKKLRAIKLSEEHVLGALEELHGVFEGFEDGQNFATLLDFAIGQAEDNSRRGTPLLYEKLLEINRVLKNIGCKIEI